MANFRRALFSFHRFLNSTYTPTPIYTHTGTFSDSFRTSPQAMGWFIFAFCSSNQSLDIVLSNEDNRRRLFNRLLYRSKQRGFLELDLVWGKWVEEHIHSLDENGIKSLVSVLDQRIGDLSLRHQLEDLDSLSEELTDKTVTTFLDQVKDGNWTSGGWPKTYTDYSMSKLAVNAYARLMAKMLSERPEDIHQ